MSTRTLITLFMIAIAGASLAGCSKKDKPAAEGAAAGDEGTAEGEAAAGAALPTEEDYEEAAEAKITPANLDAEIAKLEEELRETEKGPAKK